MKMYLVSVNRESDDPHNKIQKHMYVDDNIDLGNLENIFYITVCGSRF